MIVKRDFGMSVHLSRGSAARRNISSSPGDKKLQVSVVLPPACEYMWYNCFRFKSREQVGVGAIGII